MTTRFYPNDYHLISMISGRIGSKAKSFALKHEKTSSTERTAEGSEDFCKNSRNLGVQRAACGRGYGKSEAVRGFHGDLERRASYGTQMRQRLEDITHNYATSCGASVEVWRSGCAVKCNEVT